MTERLLNDKIEIAKMIKYYLGLNAQVGSISIINIKKDDQDKIKSVSFKISIPYIPNYVTYEFNSEDSAVSFYIINRDDNRILISNEMYQ